MIEVMTGTGGGDCGYDFKPNESYLVYADNYNGKIYTGICNRTRPLSEAAEDLEYINNLAKAGTGATIYGAVNKYRRLKSDEEWQPQPPLPDILLTLEGNGKTYEATTDMKGEFRIADLTAGSYTLRLLAPKGFYPFETEQKIKVYEKGCAAADFSLSVNTSLSGRISDEKGAPPGEIKVDLVPVEQINEPYQKDKHAAFTDEAGRFTFRTIPPGRYYFGIRFQHWEPKFAYPRTFYPGTQELNEAATVTISEGQVLENYDFQLPAKLSERKIEGIVVYPNGKPVQDAHIGSEEVEYTENSTASYSGDGKTEANGRFSLTRLNGLRYLIKAYVSNADGKQRHSEPIEIPADGAVTNLKIVITEANGNCDKCLRWKRKKG